MISDDIQDLSTEYRNMATQYGNISIKNIRVPEKTYINTPSRAAQDWHVIYKCIVNSLSIEEGNQGEYMVGGLLHRSPQTRKPTAQSGDQGVPLG